MTKTASPFHACLMIPAGFRAPLRLGALLVLLVAACARSAMAQAEEPPDGMTIRRVDVVGLETISEGYIRREIKTRAQQPFSRRQVEEDVRTLRRSRKFLAVFATTAIEEGQAVVTFSFQEKPTLASVELEGNKVFTDADLYALTPTAGAVLDAYLVNRGREDIEQKYKRAGYYYVTVAIDEALLRQENRLVYRITEGPRVKVRKIRYEGNYSYSPRRLRSRVQSETYVWVFRVGALDEEQAERDALSLQQFYRDEGYLDARVGYRLEFHPINRADLDLVFVVEEGPRYRVRDVVFEGHTVFADDALRSVMRLAPGKPARNETLTEDVKRIRDLYGQRGHVDVRIAPQFEYLEEPGVVTLRIDIDEDEPSRVGRITIRGNRHTRDEVVRRELRFYPGDVFDTTQARKAEQRLRDTGLFRRESVEIIPLEDVGGYREALVKVEETTTTQFLIGFGVSTDSGVIGSLSIDNRNFDLFDRPRTWGEFFRGQAFRGDGQRLLFQAEPGTEVTRFRIAFTEPYLLDRPVRLDTSVYLFQRGREAYMEERLGFTLSLSKRFEEGRLEGWAVEGATRIENVEISDLDPFAARDIRDAKGSHVLTSLRGAIVRDTTDSRILPTEGYRVSFGWEQVGALGGDHSFGKPAISAAWYKTLRTDILDRKSVLAVRGDVAYIVGDAPVFERYYGGGFGSMRGFSFRGVSPRSGIYDNPVGGDFIVLTGAEYSFPLYGKSFRGVTFLDMGTVEEDIEITKWRAAIGFGLRVQVDFFGPVPIVFDFGFPIARDDDDDTRIFNFAFGASF